ncbi:MAG: YceI family protein, partial [Bacteroidota bacterium]
ILFPEEAPGALTFIGNAGSDNLFTVNKWKFTRVENPDQPTEIGVTAILDMTSITCDWKDLQRNLHKKKDYFYSKKWKTATITIDGAELQEDNIYQAIARLEIKGITKDIPIDFTITGDDTEGYSVDASATVMRRKWKFTGGGPKEEVPVMVAAKLEVE